MSFFYFTTLGAIYFYALAAVCAFAVWRGGRENRLFSLCVLGVFLADRTLLATMTDEAWMITLGGVAEFIALSCVLAFAQINGASRAIAFLFAVKIAFYVALVGGAIGFGTMAAWTELAGYLQILIIGGGTLNANRGKRTGYPDTADPVQWRSLSLVKTWWPSKRNS